MGSSTSFTRILDNRVDADSPLTEQLGFDLLSGIAHAFAIVRSDGLGIMAGALDSDPTNSGSSKVVDAGPTSGAVANVVVGHVIEMLSGTAKGVQATVVAIGAGSSRLTTNANLYTQGARSGDSYMVVYGVNATDKAHVHDGMDSKIANIAKMAVGTYTGDASTPRAITHGLGTTPKILILWELGSGVAAGVWMPSVSSSGFGLVTGNDYGTEVGSIGATTFSVTTTGNDWNSNLAVYRFLVMG